MEIRLVARLMSADEPSSTRETFWAQLKRRDASSPFAPGEGERRVFREFPSRLAERIEMETWRWRQPWPMRLWRSRPFRRKPVVPKPFAISVVSIGYGSLEILLSFLARDDFPLSVKEVVEFVRLLAPGVLSDVLETDDLAVSVGAVTGSLQGDGLYADADPSAFVRRAAYVALVAPVALFLWMCSLASNAMIAQTTAASDERRALLAQMAKVDSDRAQLIEDALKLFRESRAVAAEPSRQVIELTEKIHVERSRLLNDALRIVEQSRAISEEWHREVIELRKLKPTEPATGIPPGQGPRGGAPGGQPPPGGSTSTTPPGQPILQGATYKVFSTSTSLNLDFGNIAKDLVEASAKAGPGAARELLKGVGDGIDVARKGVGLADDVVKAFRSWFGDDKQACIPIAGTLQLPGPPNVTSNTKIDVTIHQPSGPPPAPPVDPPPKPPNPTPVGTLLDERVEFDFESARLPARFIPALKKLADELRKNTSPVLIEGHADGQGSVDLNKILSQCRANAVRKFLAGEGISRTRLHTHGYGYGYFWFPYDPKNDGNRRVRVIECTINNEDRCGSAAPQPELPQTACQRFGLN